jgi:hypothetical protein
MLDGEGTDMKPVDAPVGRANPVGFAKPVEATKPVCWAMPKTVPDGTKVGKVLVSLPWRENL